MHDAYSSGLDSYQQLDCAAKVTDNEMHSFDGTMNDASVRWRQDIVNQFSHCHISENSGRYRSPAILFYNFILCW